MKRIIIACALLIAGLTAGLSSSASASTAPIPAPPVRVSTVGGPWACIAVKAAGHIGEYAAIFGPYPYQITATNVCNAEQTAAPLINGTPVRYVVHSIG